MPRQKSEGSVGLRRQHATDQGQEPLGQRVCDPDL